MGHPRRGDHRDCHRRPVYGVNTGFGALADTRVGEQDLRAAGRDRPLARRGDRRAARLTRRCARSCCSAPGRWRPATPGSAQRCRSELLELLAADLLPVVPGKGSVGASGDLAQLAHLAQPLIGEGRLRAPGGGPLASRRPRCWPPTGSSR